MNDDNYVEEFDIKRLLFRIIYSWRKIIIVTLIFTILIAGYKYITGIRSLNNAAIQESNEIAYKTNMNTYEISRTTLEKDIENLITSIERQNKYNDESILMQINSFDEQMDTISFYIDTDYQINPNLTYQTPDITDMVIRSYLNFAQNGDMYKYIMDNLSQKIDKKYIKEIVTIWADFETNMIYAQVINNDSKLCDEIIELINVRLEQSQDYINKLIGSHTFEVINKSNQSLVDLNLEETQKANFQSVTNNELSLIEKQNALATLSIPTKNVVSNISVIKSTIKYAIFSFAMGIFLVMGIILLTILLSDKLSSVNELRARYSLRVLGMIDKSSMKSLFGFIDRWLNRLEGTSTVKIAENESIKRIYANLIAILKVTDIRNSSIMITGTAKIENIELIYKMLMAEFKDNSCVLLYGGNISYTANTIMQIVDCKAVIIVEEIGRSTYTEITKELVNVKDLDKKVIGAILI